MEMTFTPESGDTVYTVTLDIDADDTPASNVIEFPGEYEGPPETVEELRGILRQNKTDTAVDMAMETARAVINGLDSMGFKTIHHAKSGYDAALLVEVIKLMILRGLGIKHPLHDTIQTIMNLEAYDITPETFLSELMYRDMDME